MYPNEPLMKIFLTLLALLPFMNKNDPCPCWSNKPYAQCCKPYHDGQSPENALKLMRSRYAAYALGLAEYLIRTSHPGNPRTATPIPQWKKEIMEFSQKTDFDGLDILEFSDGDNIAYVTFTAHLKQNGRDATFTERSLFEKIDGKWLYKSGEIGEKTTKS